MVHVNRLRLKKKGMAMFLSPLEEEILAHLFTFEEARVRDVHARMKKKVALTSVAVSLDRLYKKKTVNRRVEMGRGGAHYLYSASGSRGELEKKVVESAVDKLISSFGDVAMTYFQERFGKK